jgi:hypothetical protein
MTHLRRYWPIPFIALGIALFVWEAWDDRYRVPLLILGAVLVAVGGIKYLLQRRT